MSESDPNLEIGDRCRLSELGLARSPRRAGKIGLVVGLGITKQCIYVLLDGNKTPCALHVTYLEPLPPEKEI